MSGGGGIRKSKTMKLGFAPNSWEDEKRGSTRTISEEKFHQNGHILEEQVFNSQVHPRTAWQLYRNVLVRLKRHTISSDNEYMETSFQKPNVRCDQLIMKYVKYGLAFGLFHRICV